MHRDLNLLAMLDALLEEGSVGGAADRLHLSAPAVSRALGRLRAATGDDILVRTGRAMIPTPRAVAIREQVHALVRQAEELLTPQRDLDLATLERTFTLSWHDAVTVTAGPPLVARVRACAPGVRLRFLSEAGADVDDLRLGRIDLEVNAGRPAAPDVHTETVGHTHLVAILRAGHPAAAAPDGLTLDQYVAAEHLTVSRRGRLRDAVDDALGAVGASRQVVVSVPTVAAALHVVEHTDLLVTAPAVVTTALVPELCRRTLPVTTAPVPVVLAWHERYAGDPAHAWLRGIVRELVRVAT